MNGKPRSMIRGPRFALRSDDPKKVKACIKCVYGNGEHAEWCERGRLVEQAMEQVRAIARDPDQWMYWSISDLVEIRRELEATALPTLREIVSRNAAQEAMDSFKLKCTEKESAD